MSNISRRGADRASRLARAAALSGTSGKICVHRMEFWLRFIGVRSVVTLTVEHTWDGRAVDMIDAGKRQAVELARQF